MYIHATTPAGQAGSEVYQSSISPFRIVCNIYIYIHLKIYVFVYEIRLLI